MEGAPVSRLKPLIERICAEVGPRPSGTPEEAQAARLLKAELEPLADSVVIEELSFHRGVLPGHFTLISLAYGAALMLYFPVPWLASLLVAVSLAVHVLYYHLSLHVVDFLFPRATTQNVIARLEPSGETRRTVLFSGHHDSAVYAPLFQPPWQRWLPWLYAGLLFSMVWLVLLGVGRTLAQGQALRLGSGQAWDWWVVADWTLLVPILGFLLSVILRVGIFTNKPILGANDNLSSVAVAVGVLRALRERGWRPEHIAVWAVSFGAEEAGKEGSETFARLHAEELREGFAINMETVGAGYELVVWEKEPGVRFAPEAVALVERAAARVGIQIRRSTPLFGDSDAACLMRGSIAATTVTRENEVGGYPLWHALEDTPANQDEKRLQEVLRLCLAVVEELELSMTND